METTFTRTDTKVIKGVAVLLMMVVVLMMGYIRLMQASHDVTVKQAQLQQAQEDNVALGVAYEKAFDQSSVKAAAQAAGMTKPTTDQIEYIELGGSVVPSPRDPWPRPGTG